MSWRRIFWGCLGVVAALLAVGGGWIASLPLSSDVSAAPPTAKEEADSTVAALRPPRRARPVVAIIGINDGTETTDYLVPYGILRRADVADVIAVATEPGPVTLYPALKVEPQATVEDFDRWYPEGADYIVVPAMHRDDDPAALRWIRSQASKGAIVIGVCAGAKVVAAAGLLDGKHATTHWYSVDELRRKHPTIRHVADRRFVVNGRVATTTGISASMPFSLTLIEAIAGRTKAEEIANELGLADWDARHNSHAFKFTRPFALTAMGNSLAFWRWEDLGLELSPNVDEVSLALVADAWSRTYRSRAVTFAARRDALLSRSGIRILPEKVQESWPAERLLSAIGNQRPARALDETLQAIADRYHPHTADLVAMQLEYSRLTARH